MKIGDTLAYRSGYRNTLTIGTVTRIHKDGIIECNGWKFNPNLTIHDNPGEWGPKRAEPVTEAIEKEVRSVGSRNLLANLNWESVPLEIVWKVIEVLEGQ
jgi:hypothetical protein